MFSYKFCAFNNTYYKKAFINPFGTRNTLYCKCNTLKYYIYTGASINEYTLKSIDCCNVQVFENKSFCKRRLFWSQFQPLLNVHARKFRTQWPSSQNFNKKSHITGFKVQKRRRMTLTSTFGKLGITCYCVNSLFTSPPMNTETDVLWGMTLNLKRKKNL